MNNEQAPNGRYYLLDAPIAELADYAGVDIDEAVKIRVDAALKAAPMNMEVTARPIAPQGNLYGFASVKIGGVTVDDFKVLADKDGKLFVGAPSKPDRSGKTGYRNVAHIDKDFRADFSAAVLSAHYDAVEREQARAANLKAAPDKEKPPRIADQMKEAANRAERSNAERPAKAKAAKARDEGR